VSDGPPKVKTPHNGICNKTTQGDKRGTGAQPKRLYVNLQSKTRGGTVLADGHSKEKMTLEFHEGTKTT